MLQKCLLFFIGLLVFSSNIELRAEIVFDKKTGKKESIFDVMSQPNELAITLIFDVQEIIDDRKSEKKHPAVLTFIDKEGVLQNWNIDVEARGVFRRYNCPEMPPIKMNFKKSDLKEKGLSKFDDYKIVTHCIEDYESAKSVVLKEYLAYKYYNSITENSFRVQLLRINYVDSKTGIIRQHYGFIIEDFALLRDRVGAEKCKNPLGIAKEEINREEYKKLALFQYMIGNSDWSLKQVRNVKIMFLDGKYVVIPYDFDFAGLVLAPYARVNADYGLTSLRERVYLGFEEDLEDLEAVKKRFKKRQGRFKRKTKYFFLLHKVHRRSVLIYLKSFYKNLDNIQLPTKNGAS
ncbi:MAG: hypothetical protein AB8F94_20025 [Saprospiraceae bacterium]